MTLSTNEVAERVLQLSILEIAGLVTRTYTEDGEAILTVTNYDHPVIRQFFRGPVTQSEFLDALGPDLNEYVVAVCEAARDKLRH